MESLIKHAPHKNYTRANMCVKQIEASSNGSVGMKIYSWVRRMMKDFVCPTNIIILVISCSNLKRLKWWSSWADFKILIITLFMLTTRVTTTFQFFKYIYIKRIFIEFLKLTHIYNIRWVMAKLATTYKRCINIFKYAKLLTHFSICINLWMSQPTLKYLCYPDFDMRG